MRFGLLGAGVIGRLRAQALAAAPGCTLVAVADLDPAAARSLADAHGAATASPDDLADRDDLDAVVISTPPPAHEPQALAAFAAGTHVLCEKPLSNSVASARRMLDAADAAGRVLATGFNHRYFPALLYLKDTVDRGLIGRLDHVRAFAGHPGLSEFRSPSEYDAEVMGGGAMMDVGIHMTDLVRYVMGDVESVYGVATDGIWGLGRSEDNAMALFRGASGATASYHATWAEWKGYRFHIEAYGDRGMVRAYYAPMFAMRVTMDRPGGARRREMKLFPQILWQEKRRGWQSTVVQTFERELADFVRQAEGAGDRRNADGWDGLRAVEIADAVYRSTQSGEPVRLSPRASEP